MAESAKDRSAPVVSDQASTTSARSQLSQGRDNLSKQISTIAREIVKVEDDLARAESRMASVSLAGPDREKVRTIRDGLRIRIAALKEDHQDGMGRLQRLEQLLQQDATERAVESRKNAQGAGIDVAAQMRVVLGRLAELFHRWRVLQEEDRVAADVVRSLSPGRFAEVTTYSWSTGIDQNFAAAIAQVIGEHHRSVAEALKRQKAPA
jgi:chromosome segregation ATPase